MYWPTSLKGGTAYPEEMLVGVIIKDEAVPAAALAYRKGRLGWRYEAESTIFAFLCITWHPSAT